MYPLDFLALLLGALSRSLSTYPISLCPPLSIFRDSREGREGLPLCIPRYEIDQIWTTMDRSWNWERGVRGEWATSQFHKIELQILRTILNYLALLHKFQVKFEYGIS